MGHELNMNRKTFIAFFSRLQYCQWAVKRVWVVCGRYNLCRSNLRHIPYSVFKFKLLHHLTRIYHSELKWNFKRAFLKVTSFFNISEL